MADEMTDPRAASPPSPARGAGGGVAGSARALPPVRITPGTPAPKALRAMPEPPTRDAPPRPPTTSRNPAPVLVTLAPPFSVRLSQFFWILSFAVGGFTAVYLFVIREEQLPLIADVARRVTEGRSDETYTAAADIVFWVVFGIIVATLLAQVTLLVSFMGRRRSHVRWWQLTTLGVQVALLLLSMEWVAVGERGQPLPLLLAAQAGLVLLALLSSVLPKAIAWSARQHDIRRGHDGIIGTGDL